MQPCRGWTNAKISSSERERFFTAALLRHIRAGHGKPCFFCSISGLCCFSPNFWRFQCEEATVLFFFTGFLFESCLDAP